MENIKHRNALREYNEKQIKEGYIVPIRPTGDYGIIIDIDHIVDCYLIKYINGDKVGKIIWQRRRDIMFLYSRLPTEDELKKIDSIQSNMIK